MDQKERSLNKNKLIITIAVLTVVAGLYLVSRSYLLEKKDIAYENVAFQIYDEQALNQLDSVEDSGGGETTPPDESTDPGTEDPTTPEKPSDPQKPGDTGKQTVNPRTNYIGTLEIPKIKLKKGFVEYSSKYNNIQYNVTIIKGYSFPDVKNGNFILAGHSGSGPLAFFKNLYKLGVGDEAIVTYKNKKYTYKITKIYTQKKQGYVVIYRNVNKNTLTLITCTKDNKKLQTVYIAELE